MADLSMLLNAKSKAFALVAGVFATWACDLVAPVEPAPASPVVLLEPLPGALVPPNSAPLEVRYTPLQDAQVVLASASGAEVSAPGKEGRARFSAGPFRALLEGAAGEALVLSVHLPGHPPLVTSLHVAAAPLEQGLWYWSGDDARLWLAAASEEQGLPVEIGAAAAGPERPDGELEQQCRKCHALSDDAVAFTYFGTDGPGGVASLDALAAPRVDDASGERWNLAALSVDGSLLFTVADTRLQQRDPSSGARLVDDVAGRPVAHLAISSDGRALAFAGDPRLHGSPAEWELDFDESDLYLAELAPGGALLSPRRLLAGEGEALAWPAPAVGAAFVIAQRGAHARSALGDEVQRAELVAVPGQGGEAVILERAAPAGFAYQPALSRPAADGLVWLVFVSRAAGGPELRLAALDPARLAAGEDPSWPSFRLAAQGEGVLALLPRFGPSP
jgi:hypothetical protein